MVHPLNSEIVNYATQRTEALMALAFLATLYCGVRSLTDSRPVRWQVASVVACAAGMACKESMVTAPVMMLLLEAAFTRQSPMAIVRQRSAYYGALFATWLVLGALLAEAPRWRSAGFSSGVSPWEYLLNQPRLIVRYLRLVFVPVGLVLDYGEPVAQSAGAVLPAGLAGGPPGTGCGSRVACGSCDGVLPDLVLHDARTDQFHRCRLRPRSEPNAGCICRSLRSCCRSCWSPGNG